MRSLHAIMLLLCASASACSSTTESSQQVADSGTSSSGSGSAAEDTDASSSDAGTDAGSTITLKAPTVTMLMKMTGGLHLTWTNNQQDCDSIEGERKTAAEPYKVVFTIPDGSVDNHHDAPLDAGTVYTYRLRCKKGTSYSNYSNEKSGTP